MIQQIFYVAIGGGLGAALRFVFSYNLAHFKLFGTAIGTMLVNLSGSFLIGLLIPIITKNATTEMLRFFLISGVLGGYTTFSSFSLENFNLLKQADYTNLFLNVGTQTMGGLLLTFFGYYLANKF